jgi:hypothetical protein
VVYRSAPYVERCRVCREAVGARCERCDAPLCRWCDCHPRREITASTGKIFALLYSISLLSLLIAGLAISERLLFLIPAANISSLAVATIWGARSQVEAT